MVIYIDLVLFLNFIIDLLLLISVDLLLKRNTKILRIFLAAFIGSVSTLGLFLFNNNIILFIFKIVISIIMVITAFKYESFNYFKDNIFWLYIISIILGGSIYLIDDQVTLTNQGFVFKNNGLEVNIIILLILIPLILYKYLKKQRNYHLEYSNYYDINIYYDDVRLKGTAFLDTGNKLFDPVFHYPIILVNEELLKKNINTFLVPYNSLNNHDLLKVFKPKKIVINNKSTKKVLIGLSNINLNGVKIIINTEVI